MKKLHIVLSSMLLASLLAACNNDSLTDPTPKANNKANVGEFISEAEAKALASTFVSENAAFPATVRATKGLLDNVYTQNDSSITVNQDGERTIGGDNYAAFYRIYNLAGGKGFVIVSGDGGTAPILGYSTENSFKADSMPDNLKAVLADYRSEITYRREKGIVPMSTRASRAMAVTRAANGYAAAVAPLLGNIKWNQSPYYNAYCPPGTPVGCVATATCQIMRYWEYPSRGTGTYRYYSNYAGQYLGFDYNYDLNWNNMPRQTLTGPNDDVALLSYGVAVGLNMGFDPAGSYSYQTDVPRVLVDHYQYPNTMRNIFRDNFSDADWAATIRAELDAGRPVQYAGSGNGGGHSFVCDGYANNGYFHFNWGWGGMSDGYFLLNALDPWSLGTGGGAGGFNYYQTCVIGIEAPNRAPDPEVDPEDPDNNPAEVDYCHGGGRQAQGLYIKRVKMSSMDNITGGAADGYTYYENKPVYLYPGQNVTLAVTPGFISRSYRMFWSAWIDYNQDQQFSDDEMIFQGYSYAYDEFRRNFTLPYNIKTGRTRMRVIAKYGGYAAPCETFDYGEVEDYPVVFGNDNNNNPVTPVNPDPVTPDPDPVTPVTPVNPDPDPTPVGPSYCRSYGKTIKTGFIFAVSIAHMLNNSNSMESKPGYSDYTAVKGCNAKQKERIQINLHTSYFGFSRVMYWRVWIDVNDDGEFTDDERIFQKYALAGVRGTFTIPKDWKIGKHRMRVSMKVGGYPEACEVIEDGEVEDYTIEIKSYHL